MVETQKKHRKNTKEFQRKTNKNDKEYIKNVIRKKKNGKSKVAVRLTMLGCACVDIPAGCVEPVSENGDLRD